MWLCSGMRPGRDDADELRHVGAAGGGSDQETELAVAAGRQDGLVGVADAEGTVARRRPALGCGAETETRPSSSERGFSTS